MVTTRRGSQRQDTTNTEAPQATGPGTTSQRGRGGAGRGRGRSAARAAPAAAEAQQLQPVDEDVLLVDTDLNCSKDATPEPIGSEATSEEIPADGRVTDNQQSQAAEETPAVAVEPAAAAVEPSAVAAEPATGDTSDEAPGSQGEGSESDTEVGDDDDESGDSDDDALFGPNLMDQLASSLKDALQARAGVREASPPEVGAGSSGQKLGVTSDPSAIRWEPETAQAKVLGQNTSRRAASATKEKGLAAQLVAPPRVKASEQASTSEATKRWFQLPATKITDEVKQELRLLRLRGAYDPKRFYKSFDETKFPKHFQIGTVLENPQDFYSSRLTARERGTSITQELLADPGVAAVRKKRYAKLQQEATRYQKVKKRKTDLVRANPKPKRPKH